MFFNPNHKKHRPSPKDLPDRRDAVDAACKGPKLRRTSLGLPDLLLIIALLLIGLIPLWMQGYRVTEDASFDTYAVLTVAGKEVWRYGICDGAAPAEHQERIGTKILTVHADEGGAWVAHSDCPDQICVRTGKISKVGQTAVCLPLQAVLRIESAEGRLLPSEQGAHIDAVSR